MHNGSHSQKENRHVTHGRVTDREREKEGRRAIGYVLTYLSMGEGKAA